MICLNSYEHLKKKLIQEFSKNRPHQKREEVVIREAYSLETRSLNRKIGMICH